VLLLAALPSVAACDGSIEDPFPEKVRVEHAIDAGEEEEGGEYVDVPAAEIRDWQIDVNHRPDWIRYESRIYETPAPGEIEIVYLIEVEPDAPPGRYDFDVVYEFRLYGEAFKREVQLHFRVEVREKPTVRGPHRLEMNERIDLGQPEQIRIVEFE
jgi:hypothetical protein